VRWHRADIDYKFYLLPMLGFIVFAGFLKPCPIAKLSAGGCTSVCLLRIGEPGKIHLRLMGAKRM